MRLWRALPTILAMTVLSTAVLADPDDPYPQQFVIKRTVANWQFTNSACGWGAPGNAALTVGPKALQVRGEPPDEGDPCFWSPPIRATGLLRARLRMRADPRGVGGQFFWVTEENPSANESMSSQFDLYPDSQWHDYEVLLPATGTVTRIRFDPRNGPGIAEIQWLELSEVKPHPLQLLGLETGADQIRLRLQNHAGTNMNMVVNGDAHSMGPRQTKSIDVPVTGNAPLQTVALRIESPGLPPLLRPVWLYRPDAPVGPALTISNGTLTLRAARDGSWARLERNGNTVAALAPIMHYDGRLPRMEPGKSSDRELRFSGDGAEARLSIQGEELTIRIRSDQPCEGPVVRALGSLEQGLFAGLEYLGRRDASSSTLDIETKDHWRYAPDPLKVTMPLMTVITDRASVAMTWKDMSLQPIFASPNFLDGSADHRMALRGANMEATVRISAPQPVEEIILWAVRQKGGLPPLPAPPRDAKDQQELELRALNGALRDENGWGHCFEAQYKRQPYADLASTLFRLTGKIPQLPKLDRGGSHLPSDSIYFVTDRVQEWLKAYRAEIDETLKEQQPDGSFRYQGQYRRGHFEDTASGYCASRAVRLLEFARLTDDAQAREAGLRALKFMKRFRTPRGAQTWEVPLHTPDILASAYLAWAYVRGYEFTDDREHLREARRWALTGLPFVYQWDSFPVMRYDTIAVYGASEWRCNWMGVPVQWCGLVYAHALMQLSPYDQTLDWPHLARGILIAGQQMQYPDGPKAGCLPDIFVFSVPTSEGRRGATINPAGLVSLRLALEGQVDNLAVASDGAHRVVAPFPIRLKDGMAHIQAPRGLRYQVLIDGQRVATVDSKGEDMVELASTERKR